MKAKGLIAIVVLLCITVACGYAASSSVTKYVGDEPYKYGDTIGSMAYHFSCADVTSVTKTTNLYSGTNTVSAFVGRYNSKDKSLSNYRSTKEAVFTGDNVQTSLSRYTGDKYYYVHRSTRWNITNPNYANDSNRADYMEYTLKQQVG